MSVSVREMLQGVSLRLTAIERRLNAAKGFAPGLPPKLPLTPGFEVLRLRQASRTVAEYAVQFLILAAELGWGNKPLCTVFAHGLEDDIQDEVVTRGTPADLGGLIALASSIDQRRRERKLEVVREPNPEDSLIDRVRCPSAKSSRRQTQVPCLGCPSRGHLVPESFCKRKSVPSPRAPGGPANPPEGREVSVGRVGCSPAQSFRSPPGRTFVPPERRGAVMSWGHRPKEGGHLGVRRSVNRISQSCWWPTMGRDMRGHIRSCRGCVSPEPPLSFLPRPRVWPQPLNGPGVCPKRPGRKASTGSQTNAVPVERSRFALGKGGGSTLSPLKGRRQSLPQLGTPSSPQGQALPSPAVIPVSEKGGSVRSLTPASAESSEVLEGPDPYWSNIVEGVDVVASSIQAPYEHFLSEVEPEDLPVTQVEVDFTVDPPADPFGDLGTRDPAGVFGSLESLEGAQVYIPQEEVDLFQASAQLDRRSSGSSTLSEIAPGLW